MDFPEELTPTERTGFVTWWLMSGETLTAQQVARKFAITPAAALLMLRKLESVLPVTRFRRGQGYAWRRLDASLSSRSSQD